MRSILLGKNAENNLDVRIPLSAFSTHFHLIGGTGKGKTTAIHTFLQPLLRNPFEQSCFFVLDRLGNFSQELLLWMSSRFCPEHVRERLVYIQPSREDVVPTFNPLTFQTSGECYYRVERTTEIILRAWESVNIEAMPRLARWTFNAFMAAAQLNLTVSDCAHFLMPGSKYHDRLLGMLPEGLQSEWREISSSRNQEATRILDSSRNRLKPYFESDILRRMFGSCESRLDVLKLMRNGKIVIVDLAPQNRLSTQLGNTIGALLINEILATARSLPRDVRYPTYLLLDEFQNFVGPDIEAALPEVRQLALRLILSHQSFSQLERGDYDLTSMIFQAQSRMIFGLQGEDADILAHELASIKYDPRKVKDEIWSRRQLTSGMRKEVLKSGGESFGWSDQRVESEGKNEGRSIGESGKRFAYEKTQNDSWQKATNTSTSRTSGSSRNETSGWHETLTPEYENFLELSNRTYETFEEQKSVWARELRNLRTGQALMRLVNDPTLYRVNVKRSTPGFLSYDMQTIARKFPEAFERVERMLEKNFQSEYFAPASTVDSEINKRIEHLLTEKLVIPPSPSPDTDSPFES